MPFAHDAFMSYSSQDQPWAKRIATDLQAKGLRTFVDKQGLLAGHDWDEQLVDELEVSQHVIVVWSDHARASDWVLNEHTLFRTIVRNAARQNDPDALPRRIIPVYLEGEYKPFKKWERVDFIKRAGAYAGVVDAVDHEVWRATIAKLEATIRDAEIARTIPALLITTTRNALSHVDPNAAWPPPPAEGESLNTLVERLGIGSFAALLDCYDNDRGDWRPFGGAASSVREILDRAQDEINAILRREGLEEFRWDYLDDLFWGGSPEDAVARLKGDPAIVVLDPVSLYDPGVLNWVQSRLIPAVRQNHQASVILLPPFTMPPSATVLRESIQRLAWEVFDAYYNPPVFSRDRHARYVTAVGDLMDLKASLLVGIGPVLAPGDRGDEPRWTRA